ncbi:uncharacterized protein LOC114841620, partial [Diachasma alloeum]|uniref:uncharacterized protein LOC114841620 n=1 Tax=Diachasma alloeum TaxID=454923 RepID=UPI0010FAEA90
LQILIEVGIIKYLEKRNLPKVEYCPLNLKSTERQLKNSDLTLTYKVIAAGFISACIMFIYEMIRRRQHVSCLCCGKSCSFCWPGIETPDDPILPPPVVLQSENNYVEKESTIRHTINHNFNNDSNHNNSNRHPQVEQISLIDESIYGAAASARKTYINGRDYWVITAPKGDKRLIPIRTPSALLFQYTT